MSIFEANPGPGSTNASVAAGTQAAVANEVSGGAILAGVTLALAVQVVLTLIGTGIGVTPAAGDYTFGRGRY
ncbi:hypothetical protein GCM10011390_26690 [Aureimonas endophytica]|uniref:Uncharacterized protein n=1 Tax=Aureimonas endophytica TaxID=2027858 RepID=A0A917E6T2_9HYPH|nr:hypothetical protein [Aureimonas endophytica]GGE06243.1 hypothetical protein GCM10011390_26690 [Aureimonas endophytica]